MTSSLVSPVPSDSAGKDIPASNTSPPHSLKDIGPTSNDLSQTNHPPSPDTTVAQPELRAPSTPARSTIDVRRHRDKISTTPVLPTGSPKFPSLSPAAFGKKLLAQSLLDNFSSGNRNNTSDGKDSQLPLASASKPPPRHINDNNVSKSPPQRSTYDTFF